MNDVDFFGSTRSRLNTEFTRTLREIPEKLPRGIGFVTRKSLQTLLTFERIWRANSRLFGDTVEYQVGVVQ